MRRSVMFRSGAAMLVALVMATGCGSTAQRQTEVGIAAGSAIDDELTLGPAPTAPGPTASGSGSVSTGSAGDGTTGGGAGGTAGGPTTGGGATGSGPAPTRGTGGVRPAGPVHGVTDTDINIGVLYAEGTTLNEAAGLAGASAPDFKRIWEVLAADVNKRGGIAGRRVVLVPYIVDATGATATSVQEQAICATFAEDNEVFVAMTGATDNLNGCLSDHRVAQLAAGGLTSSDARTFEQFPFYAEAGSLNLTRQAAAMVEGLDAQRYFDAGSKIGLVTFDLNRFVRATNESLKPALAARGLSLAAEAFIKTPQTASDVAAQGAELANVVLRFKTLGINRVLFLELSGSIALFFLTSAEAQAYRPRYGMTTQSAGTILAQNVPAAQLDRAIGIGWKPSFDLAQSENPGPGPAGKRCRALLAANGMTFADGNAEGAALGLCDQMNLLKAAVEAGGPVISPESFIAGIETLHPFDLGGVSSGGFAPRQHDGVAGYQHMGYVRSCNCFRYTSKVIPAR